MKTLRTGQCRQGFTKRFSKTDRLLRNILLARYRTGRHFKNYFLGRRETGRHFWNGTLWRLGTGRGGGCGRKGENTDINNSVLGDETGLVQGDGKGRVQSFSKSIRGSEFRESTATLAEGTGLHSIFSYFNSIPTLMDDVAGSRTGQTDMVGSRAIWGSGVGSWFASG